MDVPRRVTCVAFALALGGCALKDPPPVDEIATLGMPGVALPDSWRSGGAAGTVQDDWLATFASPQLNALVSEALQHNANLQAAAARVDLAAAALKAAGANLLPAVDVLARGGGKTTDGSGLAGVALTANWELDLWGRVRYGRRAAAEQYYSTQADLVYARQSIAANVARAWVLAIEARLQRDLARAMIEDANQVVGVAQQRAEIGQGNDIDVATARVNLLSLKDSERSVDLAYTEALRALELLLGRYPSAATELVDVLPSLATTPATGVPSELLERRPDVRAARHRIAAAFSNVEQARTLRLPSITLTASASHIDSDLFVLEQRDDIVGSGAAKLYLPIFNNGQITAQIEARTAEQQIALAGWADMGLRAFREVESALASEINLGEREPLLATLVSESQRAVGLEQERYKTGTTDLRPVLQQQISTYAAQTRLLRLQSERRVQRVNLFLALGGSFAQPR